MSRRELKEAGLLLSIPWSEQCWAVIQQHLASKCLLTRPLPLLSFCGRAPTCLQFIRAKEISHYVSNQKDTSTSTTTLWLDAVLLSRTLSEHEVIVIMSICVHESQSMFRTLQYGCSSGYRTHTRTLARVRSCRRTTHDEERQAMA